MSMLTHWCSFSLISTPSGCGSDQICQRWIRRRSHVLSLRQVIHVAIDDRAKLRVLVRTTIWTRRVALVRFCGKGEHLSAEQKRTAVGNIRSALQGVGSARQARAQNRELKNGYKGRLRTCDAWHLLCRQDAARTLKTGPWEGRGCLPLHCNGRGRPIASCASSCKARPGPLQRHQRPRPTATGSRP